MSLSGILEQIYGKQIFVGVRSSKTKKEIIHFVYDDYDKNRSLRVDSNGKFYSIDTTQRSTWKGRVISLIQWFIYGENSKACNNAIDAVLAQFLKSTTEFIDDRKEIIGITLNFTDRIHYFANDPDLLEKKTLTQKIEAIQKEIFQKLSKADQDDKNILVSLAYYHHKGYGTEKNIKEATSLYKKASTKGSQFAKVALASLSG